LEHLNEKETCPALMAEVGIDMAEMRQRMAFIGMTEKDVALLSGMKAFAESHAEQIVAAFYQHLLSFRETRLILKDQASIDRLKASQKTYLLEVFEGRFDASYFERRLKTGAVHHRIGLKPKWYMEAYEFYEHLFSILIAEAYRHEADRGLARDLALRKIFRIDMVLALEYYSHRSFREMSAKLNENVREIDDFTRMLSHDLKEPLRGIEAFSGFLLEDYMETLDPEGKRYLRFLRQSALRMKELINDLLSLTSITKTGLALEEVDLNMLLKQVQQDLKFAFTQKNARLLLPSPLPILRCDPLQLREVFKNLLSNAIKFNTSSPPVIEVVCVEKTSQYVFSVQDNGIGIEACYLEQVLRPFERLHSQEEFEGTGIGLAICKKIIENAGGQIWLESEPKQGSTFFFSLPQGEV